LKKFEFCEVFLRKDGIVQIILFPSIDVTPGHVKIMLETSLELTNGIPTPILMFIGEFSTFGKEAREYSANPENIKAVSAIAYVIDNLGHKLVINFFMKINKPPKPIKMFMDETSAVDWLLQYK
jgi:hypothetical protein